MYLFSQKRFIPAFSFEETKEMVDKLGYFMGMEFSAEQIAKLRSLYGGHPFFIRQVCSKVHQSASANRPISVSDGLLEKAIEQFSGQLDSYLDDILGSLARTYPDEFELLKAIINGDKSEINEFGIHAPELIDHLIGYGIVEDRSGDLDVRFVGIRNALKRNLSAKSAAMMWAEISRRRNSLEVDIRREIYHWSRGVSPVTWLAVLEGSLTKKRLAALDSTEPRRLFSKTDSPLYLSDLIALLKDERVLPYLEDRRRNLISSLNTVNQYRKDAHATEFTLEEYDEVRAALTRVEDEFGQPT